MKFIPLEESDKIAPWLKEKMSMNCLCGEKKVINETGTMYKCGDPCCPYHMQNRAAKMFKSLGVKGMGPETCRKLMVSHGLYALGQLIPHVFGDEKPKVYDWQFLSLLKIGQMDKSWEKFLSHYKYDSLIDLLDYLPIDADERLQIVMSLPYFKIKKRPRGATWDIMLHGPIPGYRNREQFLENLNDAANGVLFLKEVGPSNYASYLVTMEVEPHGRKADKAYDNCIPIVTPEELTDIVLETIEELRETSPNLFDEVKAE